MPSPPDIVRNPDSGQADATGTANASTAKVSTANTSTANVSKVVTSTTGMAAPAAEGNGAFAAALRAAIEQRNLSLDRIRSHLKARGHAISVATLSYWQSGRSRPDRAPSLAALGSLEDILGVPRGSLAAQLPAGRRRPNLRMAPPQPSNLLASMGACGARVEDFMAELELDWNNGLRRISTQDVIVFDANRAVTSHVMRELFIATRHGADRFPLLCVHDSPDQPGLYEGTLNCRQGRTLVDAEQRLAVTELILDRPLHEGEATLIEATLSGHGVGETDWVRVHMTPVRDSIVEARFDPAALPRAASATTLIADQQRETPMSVDGGVITQVLSDFGPGLCGMRWEW